MQPQRCLLAVLVVSLVIVLAAPAASRNPTLFSNDAGFHQARFELVSIGVEARPWLSDGMRYWNHRAGWDLFVFSDEPQVYAEFDASCEYCAWAFPDWTVPYEGCRVSVAPYGRDDVSTVAHELGHCLGLRHQTKGVMSTRTPTQIPDGWKTFDRGLLVDASYVDR